MKTACFYKQHNSSVVWWLEWKSNVLNSASYCGGNFTMPQGSVTSLLRCLSLILLLLLKQTQRHHRNCSLLCCLCFIKNANMTSSQSLPASQGYLVQILLRDTTNNRHTKQRQATSLFSSCCAENIRLYGHILTV